jgi:hypothetical protein
MKVLCVTNDFNGKWSSFSSHDMIKIGNWYDVANEGDDYYTIIWDSGYEANLSKEYFKTVEQLREEKLNELGL